MKNFRLAAAALIIFVAVSGCKSNIEGNESIAPDEESEWKDPHFEMITIGTFNYTKNSIAGLYLMKPNNDDIAFAAHGSVRGPVPPTATEWEMGSSGPAMAWDLRWKSPIRFKIWWQRIFDENLFRRSGQYPKDGNMFDPYDPYTTKQARPGSAWCESELEINEQFGEPYGSTLPNMKRRELLLYFFPDGTVKGSLEFSNHVGMKLVDITKRNELPALTDRACLKEVPNPFYRKPRPRTIN